MAKSKVSSFRSALVNALRESKSSVDNTTEVARAEIARIVESWAKRPARATESSAMKLIVGYYNSYREAVRNAPKIQIGRDACAGSGDLIKLRTRVDNTEEVDIGKKLLRDRLRDLCETFGSYENLKSFKQALESHKRRIANRQRPKALTSACRNSMSKIHRWDEKLLYKLLIANLGNPVLKPIQGFVIPMTPAELCELIALKLILGKDARHQALKVPEVTAFDKHQRTLASCEQRRVLRTYGPEYDRDPEYVPAIRIRTTDKGREVLTTDPSKAIVKMTEMEKEVCIGERWEDVDGGRALIPITKKVKRTVLMHNMVSVESPWSKPKNWDDLWVSPKNPQLYMDRTQPLDTGGFVQYYTGPSLVLIRNGLPVRPEGMCPVCDSRNYAIYAENGKIGKFVGCKHFHVAKWMIREDHWYPKLDIEREILINEDTGDSEKIRTTLLADPKHMRLVSWINQNGRLKHKLEFDHKGMRMPLLVPEFKRTIKQMLSEDWDRDWFAAPPILAEQFVPNSLKRNKAWMIESRPRRIGVLHIFIPMENISHLFNLKLLPKNWESMALRCQITGYLPHLKVLCYRHHGLHLRETFNQSQRGVWTLIDRTWL